MRFIFMTVMGAVLRDAANQPPCPRCKKSFLVREIVKGGEMLTCTAGCGARFWLDR